MRFDFVPEWIYFILNTFIGLLSEHISMGLLVSLPLAQRGEVKQVIAILPCIGVYLSGAGENCFSSFYRSVKVIVGQLTSSLFIFPLAFRRGGSGVRSG